MTFQPTDRPDTGTSRFARFAKLVQDSIGVRLPASKKLMVEGRLRRRMQELGFGNVEDYFRHLFEGGALDDELGVIFDAVTTNTTDFFREAEHFARLTETLIPARLSRVKAQGASTMFKVWSAAASTGAEAYTAAMVLADRALRRGAFEWGVLGTDINTQVLAQARRATYSNATVAPIPQAYRDRFLMHGTGSQAGHWRIVPDLRRKVQFQQLNLMDPSYPVDHDLDVIFLRNVLIYFDPQDQAKVIARLVDHLAPRGHLIVGHSESMVVRLPGMTQISPAIYRKDGN